MNQKLLTPNKNELIKRVNANGATSMIMPMRCSGSMPSTSDIGAIFDRLVSGILNTAFNEAVSATRAIFNAGVTCWPDLH